VKVHHHYQQHWRHIVPPCQRYWWQIAIDINDTGGIFTASVNDTGGKFTTGVNNIGGKK
jgi:hypothetical protein